MQLSTHLATQLEKLKASGTWEQLIEKFLKTHEKELKQEKPEPVRTKSRHIPIHIQKYVRKRSNNTCEYKDCLKFHTSLHHTQRWATEKVHDPDRIIALCTAHERIIHQGLVENEEIHPSRWRLLKKQDKINPKYFVDQFVQLYRHNAKIQPT